MSRTQTGRAVLTFFGIFAGLLVLHAPLLRLPYYWDEAGYYIPAALDFYRYGLLIPEHTLKTGHPPLVPIYLGLTWHVFGCSPAVTRVAMLLIASAAIAATYALGRRVTADAACRTEGAPSELRREPAAWAALLLALSPLFFAHSSLALVDLAAGLFTTLGLWSLVEWKLGALAAFASLAVLSKETAVVLLPVAWLFALSHRSQMRGRAWVLLVVPLLPLAAWTAYYHHSTGYWTGNREYLEYNLYSTLSPGRIFFTLLRRLYQVLIGGFNWLLAACGLMGLGWCQKREPRQKPHQRTAGFVFLTASLGAAYILMLSVVGGAILPRYLLPVWPALVLAWVLAIWRLPPVAARLSCALAGACFVAAWFINPPYPFPFEDNLAYADFVRLHQQAARYLASLPGDPVILTAWPATDELRDPALGYVDQPLRVAPLQGFALHDFDEAPAFDYLYLYSRRWEPPGNWLTRFPSFERVMARYFNYTPQISEAELLRHYPLALEASFERRGQWVRIYRHVPGGLNSTGGSSLNAPGRAAAQRRKDDGQRPLQSCSRHIDEGTAGCFNAAPGGPALFARWKPFFGSLGFSSHGISICCAALLVLGLGWS
jgi:4-amino-4-deoxy-L-arabinose transferase-like glycosyltransferase